VRASNYGFRTGAELGNPARFALGASGLVWQAWPAAQPRSDEAII
jgi:hypothetical protein